MSVSVTVTFASAEEAITALAKLRVESKDTPTPKPAASAKDKPAATPPSAAKTDAPATPPAASPTPAPAPVSVDVYKDKVSPAISAGANKNKPATVATLAEFGAKTGKDLKPEQYEEFLVKLAAALEPKEDLT